MRLYRTPAIVQALFPSFVWRGPETGNTIYVTFDDGPIPEVTEFVLAQLAQFQAQATFFCVGENIHKYPAIAQRILRAGHRLGNHTYNHVKGWQTPTTAYMQNIKACDQIMKSLHMPDLPKLFRPPHGRFTYAQAKLIKSDYQVIMWDVLSYDFDRELTPEACLVQAIKNTKGGSIVVFHDSLKARRNLEYVLPRYLAHFARQGFRFRAL